MLAYLSTLLQSQLDFRHLQGQERAPEEIIRNGILDRIFNA